MPTIFISPKNQDRPHIQTALTKINDSFIEVEINDEDKNNIANYIQYCDLIDGKFFFDKAKFDDFIIKKHKNELLKEIGDFFKLEGKARLIKIQNCYPQPIFCDQNFINNLNSAKDQAKILGYYHHKILDNNNLGIIDKATNKLLAVDMSLDTLETIKIVVELRRGYCYKANLWHNTKINLINNLQELEEHKAKYSSIENEGICWSGSDGAKYIPPCIIKIKDGVIINKEEVLSEAN